MIYKLNAVAAAVTLTVGLVGAIQAGPALNVPQEISQPDGSTFTSFARGDEFQGWVETTDRRTVLLNHTTGYYEYAVSGARKQLELSGINVRADSRHRQYDPAIESIPTDVKPPFNDQLFLYQQESIDEIHNDRRLHNTSPNGWTPIPVSGNKRMLVIMVGFVDTPSASGGAQYWSSAIFDTNSASVTRYYKDQSFAATNIIPVPHTQPGKPTGVISVQIPTFHPRCGSACTYATETNWVNRALAEAAKYVNFANLDTNNNGDLSGDEVVVYFITAGYESSVGAGSPGIWAHAWGGNGVTAAGLSVRKWAMNGEWYNSSRYMTMGIVAHEMGHALFGLPDLYDISYLNSGMGAFSLMASGSWGRKDDTETSGTTPVNLDAWSRQYLGWSTPRVVPSGTSVGFADPLLDKSSTLQLINSAITSSEFWLIENRTPTGWDRGLYPYLGAWKGGLLIQHVDTNIGDRVTNSINKYTAGSHQGVMVEEPSTASCSLVRPGGSRGCTSLLYSANTTNTFNANSTPSSAYYVGNRSGVGVSGISPAGAYITGLVEMPSGVSTVQTNMLSVRLNAINGSSGGVVSDSTGISCGTNCSSSFKRDTTVTLTATAGYGSVFAGWSGDCTGLGSRCTVSMSTVRNIVANFTPMLYRTISVAKYGGGTGTIASTPTGISCGTTCVGTALSFPPTTNITLTATAAAGSVFQAWSGDCVPSKNVCVIQGGSTTARALATFNLTSTASTTTLLTKVLSGSVGSMVTYAVVVPSKAKSLNVTLSGGTGDADLYVRANNAPTVYTFSCRSAGTGTTENCTLNSPIAGTYYIGVHGFESYNTVTTKVSWTAK